jgi:hypothetical protein
MSTQHEHFDTRRLNAISITEVARRLGCSLKKAGSVSKTVCPWHDDANPSLTLYERTDENRCHCFACGKGGSVIDFVMQREQWSFQEACRWLSGEFGIPSMTQGDRPRGRWPKPKPLPAAPKKEFTYIPVDMLDALVSSESSLCRCLMQLFQPEAVQWLAEEYRLGCYAMGDQEDYTVFPNIDRKGRVCNLKVQHYDTDPASPRFAHSDEGSCYWLGSIWQREGRLSKDAQLQSSCLFGEHLLPLYPDSTVALVESPKNALFGALAFPQLTWVATGNKTALQQEVLLPLQGRNVMVIPDRDAIQEWKKTIDSLKPLANFTVSDFCERMAPEGDLKFDIADYLVSWIQSL